MGGITAVAGVALIVLPFASWYVARLPSGSERASGVDASGELWLVPALGALVLLSGIAIVLGRAPALAGTTAAIAGGLAAAWALVNIAQVPVGAVLDDPPDPVPVAVDVDVLVAAPLTAVAGALAVLTAGVVALRGWVSA
jgi:hypothetical protein